MEKQIDKQDKKPNRILRHVRQARGWTQRYVAGQLGADENIVSRWECGERKPSPYYIQKLSALFGMSAVELGLVEIPTPFDQPPHKAPGTSSIQSSASLT